MAKLSQTHCSCPINNCKKAIHFPFSSTWTKDRQNEVTILANDYKKSWICSSLAQPDPTRHLWAVAVTGCAGLGLLRVWMTHDVRGWVFRPEQQHRNNSNRGQWSEEIGDNFEWNVWICLYNLDLKIPSYFGWENIQLMLFVQDITKILVR